MNYSPGKPTLNKKHPRRVQSKLLSRSANDRAVRHIRDISLIDSHDKALGHIVRNTYHSAAFLAGIKIIGGHTADGTLLNIEDPYYVIGFDGNISAEM